MPTDSRPNFLLPLTSKDHLCALTRIKIFAIGAFGIALAACSGASPKNSTPTETLPPTPKPDISFSINPHVEGLSGGKKTGQPLVNVMLATGITRNFGDLANSAYQAGLTDDPEGCVGSFAAAYDLTKDSSTVIPSYSRQFPLTGVCIDKVPGFRTPIPKELAKLIPGAKLDTPTPTITATFTPEPSHTSTTTPKPTPTETPIVPLGTPNLEDAAIVRDLSFAALAAILLVTFRNQIKSAAKWTMDIPGKIQKYRKQKSQ